MSATAGCDRCGRGIRTDEKYVSVNVKTPTDDFGEDNESFYDAKREGPEESPRRRRFMRGQRADLCLACFAEHGVADVGRVIAGSVPERQ